VRPKSLSFQDLSASGLLSDARPHFLRLTAWDASISARVKTFFVAG